MSADAEGVIPPVCLRTPRLTLRAWRSDDRDEFTRVSRISREFWRPWVAAPTREHSLEHEFDVSFQYAARGLESGTQCRLIAELRDGRIAGFFSLSEIVRGIFQNAYAGWRVSADVVGNGYATEGVSALLDIAFAMPPEGLGLHRVQANIIPTNEPSLRLAAKCGFRREGYALRYMKIAGAWQDHIMLAKTVEEHEFVYRRGNRGDWI